MMSPSVAAILAGPAGRELVSTADTLNAQGRQPDALFVAACGDPGPARGLLDSLAARLGARIFSRPGLAEALNEALSGIRTDYVAFVRAGFLLQSPCLAACAARLDDDPRVAAVVPGVHVRAPDGRRGRAWPTASTDLDAALGDTRSVPPVVVVRRSVIPEPAFDPTLNDEAVAYDFWVRLLAGGGRVLVEPASLAYCVATPRTAGAPAEESRRGVEHFRPVFQKHRLLVEDRLPEMLVRRELAYAALRERHQDLLAARDRDLAELDRRRAEVAHQLAFLRHHGREGLDWGDFRRSHPFSRDWGYDRGTPVDRRHIEDFLASRSGDIRGRVLEVQEDDFTRRFGGPRVEHSAVVDIDPSNPRAALVADLRAAPHLPSGQFDCIIFTQTLHVIAEMQAVLTELHRLLRAGGVLLMTLPSASRVCLEYGDQGDFWRVTPAGGRALGGSVFGAHAVDVTAVGNVLTTVAFLEGLAAEELSDDEYARTDVYFPAIVGVRARKTDRPLAVRLQPRGVVLLYHRICPGPDAYQLNVDPGVFQRQVEYIRSTCQVVPLDWLLRAPDDQLPDRAVALTFDDGYVDGLTVAAPLLDGMGLPATFFLTSRWLERPGEYWWDVLERVLLGPGDLPDPLDLDLAGARIALPTGTPAGRQAAHARLHRALVLASFEERERMIARIAGCDGIGRTTYRPMHADEVRRLAGFPGVTIGAHTVNHLALSAQPAGVVERELADCRHDLGRVVERPIEMVAYPYAAVDRTVADRVRREWMWGMDCADQPVASWFDAARVPRLDVGTIGAEELPSRLDRLFANDSAL